MSKIGRKPVSIKGVKVTIEDGVVKFAGSLGIKEYVFDPNIIVLHKDNELLKVEVKKDLLSNKKQAKRAKEIWGLTRALINNTVIGVREGFKEIILIKGIGYTMNASKEDEITLNVGYSHPVILAVPKHIKFNLKDNRCELFSDSKELLGKFTEKLLSVKKYDIYKDKGIKKETAIIKLKVGKSGKK